MANDDKIIIRDLEVETRIGVTPAEQEHPQKLLVSVEMELDLSVAGHTDVESATTDYEQVAQTIRQTVTERTHKLVEAVAHDVAELILYHRWALAVTVEVKKFSIPRAQYVAVQIRRSQS